MIKFIQLYFTSPGWFMAGTLFVLLAVFLILFIKDEFKSPVERFKLNPLTPAELCRLMCKKSSSAEEKK